LRTPDEGSVVFDDAIRGDIEIAWADVPDFVIQRADGSPTYYLANTVDDLAQGITLVARGEDLLSATPRQLLLVDALLAPEGPRILDSALAEAGLPGPPAEGVRPTYAHLPIIVGEDRKKLGKRHGSVAVDSYREQGFLPEVLVNFLALCGWSYDDRTERFTVEELVERFSFERVSRNPAFFDTDKLRSLNGDRIKELADTELAGRLAPYFAGAGLVASPPSEPERALLEAFAPLLRERIQTLAEAPPLVAFAFRGEVAYDDAAVAKHLRGRAGDVLDAAASMLADLPQWSGEAILEGFDGMGERLGLGRGKVMQPVRVAVAGTAVSPPLPETLAVLDRETVVSRVRQARALVSD
jgi:glutamyl-tRNA synthetase